MGARWWTRPAAAADVALSGSVRGAAVPVGVVGMRVSRSLRGVAPLGWAGAAEVALPGACGVVWGALVPVGVAVSGAWASGDVAGLAADEWGGSSAEGRRGSRRVGDGSRDGAGLGS
ncbi:hypothetical protein SHKM778_84570 [Streptomyces sp. KM77-8]|uniref:Uncharacterized protein n=1 Tax=Streptomyces haneummycinicus TaxID=3074435 RepID=A0AAT9HXV4_9ACTN